MNSINLARILVQTVYYFTSAAVLGGPYRKISFVVPTGNFGDILAGWMAKRMGLPIDRLVIATNSNDILARTLASGRLHCANGSPNAIALDGHSGVVQFRTAAFRSAWTGCGRALPLNGEAAAIAGLRSSPARFAAIRAEFDAFSVDEAETTREIARTLARNRLSSPTRTPRSASARARKARRAHPRARSSCWAPRIPPNFPTRSRQRDRNAAGSAWPSCRIYSSEQRSFRFCPTTRVKSSVLSAPAPRARRAGPRHERRDHHFALRPEHRHRSHGAS